MKLNWGRFLLVADRKEVEDLLEAAWQQLDVLLHPTGGDVGMRAVQALGDRVVGVARTEREAIEPSTRPGLMLADIRLVDGSSGIHAVNEILRTFSVPGPFRRPAHRHQPELNFLIRSSCRFSDVLYEARGQIDDFAGTRVLPSSMTPQKVPGRQRPILLEMAQWQWRAGLERLDRNVATYLSNDGQREQFAHQKPLIVRQLWHDNFQKVVGFP
jgi:hypothetical protein